MHESDSVAASTWDTYIGQCKMKERLAIEIEAAVLTDRTFQHTLLAGPAGYGKSTLARIIAGELNDSIVELVMPVKPKVIAAALHNNPFGILFLDEIHLASKGDQNTLLSLLEDGFYQTTSGLRVDGRRVTVIGATTEEKDLIKPLRDRFMLKPFFESYTSAEMAQIVTGMGARINVHLMPETADGLARATGGVPRMARRLVLAARSLSDTGRGTSVPEILDQVGVDSDGLTEEHFAYLNCLKSLDGSAGLAMLTKMLQTSGSVLDDIERLLVERGFIRFASTGREMLAPGWAKVAPAATRHREITI